LGGYGVSAISFLVSAHKTSTKKELPVGRSFLSCFVGLHLRKATASPPTARPQMILELSHKLFSRFTIQFVKVYFCQFASFANS